MSRTISSVEDLNAKAIKAAGDKLIENNELTLKQAILMTAPDIPTVTLDEEDSLRTFKKLYRKMTGKSLVLVG